MSLDREWLLEQLREGKLVIDPPLDNAQIGSSYIELRIGTEFLKFSPSSKNRSDSIRLDEKLRDITSVKVGQSIIIKPSESFRGTTLEYVELPNDISAITNQRSSFGRLGLMVTTGLIEAGYHGKVVLELSNVGIMPIALYPGQRILRLVFFKIKASTESRIVDLDTGAERDELARLQNNQAKRLKKLETEEASFEIIRDLLTQVINAEESNKGKLLEKLATAIFITVKGLKIIKVNARLKAEELDLVLQNDIDSGFWRMAGSPIIVECKNWSRKVGSKEISILGDKLESVSPDAKTGILITLKGVTGSSSSNAILKIREMRQRGRYIIVLDLKCVEEIANGTNAALVIERRFNEMLLI